MDATSSSAYPFEGHGQACLYELRFADALPKLKRAAHLDPAACTLVALGVAYDGLSRRREAAEIWQRARRAALKDAPFTLGLELPLLHGDDARAMRILKEQMELKYHADGSYQTVTGADKDLANQFGLALERAAAGFPDQGARMITSLYRHDGLEDYGAVRYARAVMLLATNREQEAQMELRLAAVLEVPMAGEDCLPGVYQWSAVYLLEHLH